MHPLQVVAEKLRGSDWHVRYGRLVRRHGRRELERGLARGLVPRGHEATCIGILELGEQCARLALRRLVIKRKQTRGALVDLAVIREHQGVRARLQRVIERESGGFRRLVVANRRRSRLAGQRRAIDDDVGAVQGELVGGLMHRHIDCHRGLESERAGVGHQIDAVVFGRDGRGENHALAGVRAANCGATPQQDATERARDCPHTHHRFEIEFIPCHCGVHP